MISFYWLIFPALAAAVLGMRTLGRRLPLLPEKTAGRLLLGLTAAVFAVYAMLGWWKYGAFQYGLWDFGIYDSLLHKTAAGEGIMQDFRGGLYDHFSPVLLLLVPLYRIWDSPMQLVWFQAAAMAAGIPLFYLLSKKYLRNAGAALTAAVLYVLNPYYSRIALYDFHIECLFPAFFFGAFLARAHGFRRTGVLILMASIFIKEDFVIPVAATGFFFLFSRPDRKYGVALMTWSVLMTFVVLKIYFPCFSTSGYWHYGRYELLAPTLEGTVRNIFFMLRRVVIGGPGASASVLMSLLLPFALLPLLHWKMFLFVLLPALGIQLASTAVHQNLLASHYSSALIAVVPVAALWGMRVLRVRGGLAGISWKRLVFGVLCFGAVWHIFTCDLPMTRYNNYITGWEGKYHFGMLSVPLRPAYYLGMLEQDIRGEELRQVLPLIQPGSRVMCQNELGCPLLRAYQVRDFSGSLDADYFLFDSQLYGGGNSPETLNAALQTLLAMPDVRILYRDKGILLLERAAGRAK